MVGLGFCSKTEGGSSVTCIPRGCPTPQPEASGRTGVCRPLCRACTRHRGPGTMLSASCAFECRCATCKAGRAPARCRPTARRPQGRGTEKAAPAGEGTGRRGHTQNVCRQNPGKCGWVGGGKAPFRDEPQTWEQWPRCVSIRQAANAPGLQRKPGSWSRPLGRVWTAALPRWAEVGPLFGG